MILFFLSLFHSHLSCMPCASYESPSISHIILYPILILPLTTHHHQHNRETQKFCSVFTFFCSAMDLENNPVMSSEVPTEDYAAADGSKRSYDCTFCKRGFTNAQALGGHMNIHRKDKAKGKQEDHIHTSISDSSFLQTKFTNYEQSSMMTLNPFASEFPSQPLSHYSILDPQRNSAMHFHPSPAPTTQLAPLHVYDQLHDKRSQSEVHFNQGFWGADLSLQTGPTHVDHNKDSEVDLELRLGHDP